MKCLSICVGVLLTAAASPSLHAQSSGGLIRMPGDECRNIPYPLDASVVLSAEQEKALRCWFDSGSNDAGIRLVQSYMAEKPIDYPKAVAVLSVLVRESVPISGSLASKSLSVRPVSSTRIGFGDSISPAVERQRSPLAERILAQLYMAGRGVDKNPAAALKWIKRAEKGDDQVARELHQEWLAKGLVEK
ncbi:MAG: SEL1-like repeat protein [Rubritepida sp.]|nr:SEL1-like repeat protein [Rubritepida sp.]